MSRRCVSKYRHKTDTVIQHFVGPVSQVNRPYNNCAIGYSLYCDELPKKKNFGIEMYLYI